MSDGPYRGWVPRDYLEDLAGVLDGYPGLLAEVGDWLCQPSLRVRRDGAPGPGVAVVVAQHGRAWGFAWAAGGDICPVTAPHDAARAIAGDLAGNADVHGGSRQRDGPSYQALACQSV